MNEGKQGGRRPEGGTPSVLRHSLSPLVSHPPLYSASRGVRGTRRGEGAERGGEERAGQRRKSQKCPPSLANSGATSAPSSRRGGVRRKALPVALHRGGAERTSPGSRHPRRGRRRARAQCRSTLPCRALPLSPANPLKPPGLAAASPGRNAGRGWGRTGAAAAERPVRRNQQRGTGGREEMPGPRGAQPGRSGGGGSGSPGTAPSLAAMEPEHFPPSGQALGSARVLGEEGPAPEPPRRAAERAKEPGL